MAPADLGLVPARIPLDWFYLFPHPLMAALGPGGLWATVAGLMALLALAPYATRVPRAAAARVSLANCNGCARCFADCPYGAVVMVPRTDARAHPRQAQVDANLCAGCGICTGACPSSTPFRRGEELVTGIDMPSAAIGELRARLEERTAALTGA
jgi:ferredoxin